MKTTLIVGYGPNDLKVPLLVAPSKAEAEKYLEDAGCVPNLARDFWDVPSMGDDFYCGDEDAEEGEDGYAEWQFWKQFITSGYFGCGGIDGFEVVEVDMLTPFLLWDLD